MGILFKHQSNLSLGISISNTLLSIVQLRQYASGLALEEFGIKALNHKNIYNNKIVDTESMGHIISELVKSLEIKTMPAVTNVSQGEVITKIIQLPAALSDSEMEAQIRIDADLYIPYPLATVSFDYESLGESITYRDLQDVLLVISQTENVDLRVDSLAFANIDTQVVEVDIHAIERAYQFILNQTNSSTSHLLPTNTDLGKLTLVNSKRHNSSTNMASTETHLISALVDIGETRTTVYIANYGEFLYQSEKLFGCRSLYESVQTSYAFDENEANEAMNKWRVDNCDTPVDYIELCFEPFVDSLIDHITQTFEDFKIDNTETSGSKINGHNSLKHIMLCGGGACLSGIEALLGSKMGIQIETANPFKHMRINPKLDKRELFKIAPRLMTTFGLSIREFNSRHICNKQKI